MFSRDDAILFVIDVLNEDIVDQFNKHEKIATLNDETLFSIQNKRGEKVTLCNAINSDISFFNYDIVSYYFYIERDKNRECSHPAITKQSQEDDDTYLCYSCGLIANIKVFNKRKER